MFDDVVVLSVGKGGVYGVLVNCPAAEGDLGKTRNMADEIGEPMGAARDGVGGFGVVR